MDSSTETLGAASRSSLAQSLWQMAEESAGCHSAEAFSSLIRDNTYPLLPHRSLIAIVGRVDLDHLQVVHIEAVGYPEHGFLALQRQSNLRQRSALIHWLKHRAPLVFDVDKDAGFLSPFERDEIAWLELGRVGAHGVLDLVARSGTCFSFGGIDDAMPAEEVRRRLALIVPHLHQALLACHFASNAANGDAPPLTSVERELLKWVAAGRTNSEIAALRGRSEATVRNQLTVVFKKLGVSNRAAATRVMAGLR